MSWVSNSKTPLGKYVKFSGSIGAVVGGIGLPVAFIRYGLHSTDVIDQVVLSVVVAPLFAPLACLLGSYGYSLTSTRSIILGY